MRTLEIARDQALRNAMRAEEHDYRQDVATLRGPIDRGQWWMTPQTVNAVNLPIQNALNFPAAILQPPYFDPRAPAADNYGAIGAVIGHEISHSFDDQGSQFDATGTAGGLVDAGRLRALQGRGGAARGASTTRTSRCPICR